MNRFWSLAGWLYWFLLVRPAHWYVEWTRRRKAWRKLRNAIVVAYAAFVEERERLMWIAKRAVERAAKETRFR